MPGLGLDGRLTGDKDAGFVGAVAEGKVMRAHIEVVNEDHAVSLQKEGEHRLPLNVDLTKTDAPSFVIADADMVTNATLATNRFSSTS